MTRNPQNSAWEDSYKTERQRRVANQGGAQDAELRMARHQRANERTANRTIVSNVSHKSTPYQHEFNAVASESRKSRRRNNEGTFGERNAQATWTSSTKAGFPLSRTSPASLAKRYAIPAIVLVVLIVIIVFIARGCTG